MPVRSTMTRAAAPSGSRGGFAATGRNASRAMMQLLSTTLPLSPGTLGDEDGLGGPDARLLLDLLFTQLLRHHRSLAAGPRAPQRGLAEWQVKRVTAHMHEHLERTIALEELAALVGLSRFHFCTAFRLATGRTPHGWLTELRIEHARQLLADPELRISDVALAVGYATPSAFTATFGRIVGLTPSEYRRGL